MVFVATFRSRFVHVRGHVAFMFGHVSATFKTRFLKGPSLFRRGKFKNRACGAAVSCIPKNEAFKIVFGARIIIRASEEQQRSAAPFIIGAVAGVLSLVK